MLTVACSCGVLFAPEDAELTYSARRCWTELQESSALLG